MPETKPLAQITQEAIQILYQKLGIVDTGHFIVGLGDYTAEREALFADMTLDDILTEIKLERKWDDSENQSAVD